MRRLVVVVVLLGVLPSPVEAATDAPCSSSPGVVDNGWVVIGTAGDDTIDCSGAAGGRFVFGLDGADVIVGSDAWADVIVPGDGPDIVQAGDGPGDLIDFIAAPGPVTASTTGASDDGQGASDRYGGIDGLVGSAFADTLTGDDGPNLLRGAGGDDLLVGAAGDDILDGGPGVDVAGYASAAEPIVADLDRGMARGDGRDVLALIEGVRGSPFDDVLKGSAGGDALAGEGGVDILEGSSGPDRLEGGRGADTLVGGSGRDSLAGGRGFDACASGSGDDSIIGCAASPFGEAGGVVLFRPSRSLVGIGFHESLFATALPIRPHGALQRNANPARFAPPGEIDGTPYVVMASRGRSAPATTSADVVVASASAVLSPVTGTVALVRRYLLYCQAWDWQVVIRPDQNPELQLMVLHTTDIRVRPGDRVVAGITQVGVSWGNDLPTAEENLYFPPQYPHVHIEVELGDTVPVPGCL
jgi:Ca2+-binding RTX toxin-like protein